MKTIDVVDVGKYAYFRSFFSYLYDKILEIGENKTHGLFFLYYIDFCKFTSENQDIELQNFIDPKLINFYFSQIGNNIILSAFILKSFFLEKNILDFVDKDVVNKKLWKYVFGSSNINTNKRLDFNNNQIKNRNDINFYLFEIKLILLEYFIDRKKYHYLALSYLKQIENFFNDFEKFLHLNCATTLSNDQFLEDGSQEKYSEIYPASYHGLQDLRGFFKESKLIRLFKRN